MGWGAALGAIGTIGSALIGKSASDKATKAQTNAANQGLALQQQIWQQQQANLAPYMGYGTGAGGLGGLASLMAGNYSGFENSPDYLYNKAEMMGAVDDRNANQGSYWSEGANLDMMRHVGGLASQNLNNYRNALMWGANLGQNAAAGVGQAGQNYANQAGNLYGNIGQAQASGALTNANLFSGALNGLAGIAGSAYGNPSSSSYGGGANAGSFGLPAPVDPYANTNYGR